MISTTEKPENRREKVKKLRVHHQALLDKLGVPNALFIPKMAYKPLGKSDIHVAFYLSEINGGEDVYVEFVSKDLVPEDKDRRLFKWRFNPHFQDEYDTTEPHPQTGHVRYLIPIDELVQVSAPVDSKEEEAVQVKLNFSLPDPDTDLPIAQLTIRDLAAIMLKKPVSHKSWLNDIISK